MCSASTTTLFLAVMLFIQVNFIVMTFITRDALLVAHFGRANRAEFSAIFVIVSSLVSTPAFAIASKFSQLLGRATTSILCTGSLILFYVALTATTSTEDASWWSFKVPVQQVFDPKTVVGTYYVFSDVCVMLLQNEFWEICNSAFKIAESKQAFGHILMGNTVANLFIGFLFVPSLEAFEITTASRMLIIAVIAGILACMMATSIFFTHSNTSPHKKSTATTTATSNAAADSSLPGSQLSYSRIFSRSYYRHMCLFEFCATALRVFVDLQTVNVLANLLDSEAFASKLALIKGLAALLMIPLQLGTGAILKKVGVVYGLATLPLATWFFGLGTMLLPSAMVVVVARSIHDSVGYTIFTQSRELLFLPLTSRERKVIKPLVTGTIRSIAKASGALLSIVMRRVFVASDSSSTLAVMIITISSIWLADVLSARRAYADEFYQLLHSMTGRGAAKLLSERVDVRHLDMADPKVLGTVKKMLETAAPAQQVFILESLPAHSLKQFRSILLDLVVERKYTRVRSGKRPTLQLKHCVSSMSLDFELKVDDAIRNVDQRNRRRTPVLRQSSLNEQDLLKSNTVTTASMPLSPSDSSSSLSTTSTTSTTSMNSTTFLNSTTTTTNPSSPISPRVRSATSFEMGTLNIKHSGIISAPNSPLTRKGGRKSTRSFDENSGDDTFIRALVSPTQQLLRSKHKKRRNEPISPPLLYSTPVAASQFSSGLPVAIRKKALNIMCESKLSTSDDLLMLVCDPHLDLELRTEAVRMCGLYHHDIVQIRRKLDELCSSSSTSKVGDLLRASAAISLLRITDWQHTNAHVVLYKMLHDDTSRTKIVALQTVGTELPELISDGYLIYLLHVALPGSSLLEAAVRCCSGRRSIILLPLLFDKLSDPSLRDLVVTALVSYSEEAVLKHARQALSAAVQQLDPTEHQFSAEEQVGKASFIDGCARWMAKCKLKDECTAMTHGVLQIAIDEIHKRWPPQNANDRLDSCMSLACFLTFLTPLINFLVLASPEPSTLLHVLSIQDRLTNSSSKHDDRLHVFLSLVIRSIESNIDHVSSVDTESNTTTSTTTATLQLVRLGALLRKNVRLLMQLCAIQFFPSSLSVDLLFESFVSSNEEHRAAAHEVLENMLNSNYRKLVLPCLTTFYAANKTLLSVPTTASNNGKRIQNRPLSSLEVLRVLMSSILFSNVALEDVHRVMEQSPPIIKQIWVGGGLEDKNAREKDDEIFIATSNGDLFFTESPEGIDKNSCLISVSLKKLASMFQASPTILRGVLSVLLLDLKRTYVSRIDQQRKKRTNSTAASSLSSLPLESNGYNQRLSTLRLNSTRATGQNVQRLSKLELCICLKDVQAFHHLTNDTIQLLAESGEQCVYSSNESIFCKGESGDCVYIIVEGVCHLYSKSGKSEYISGTATRGYIIGELSLLPSSPRLVTLKVAPQSPRSEALIIKFSSLLFLKLMAKERSLAQAIAAHVLKRIEKQRKESNIKDTRESLGIKLWKKIRRSVIDRTVLPSLNGEEEGEEEVETLSFPSTGTTKISGLRRRK